ncbi:hypothetical protein FQR65_LT15351 [Abscondita terminalis]|nr:hypothetical protein FQR65_LT15351 [Abscondita terminalis]
MTFLGTTIFGGDLQNYTGVSQLYNFRGGSEDNFGYKAPDELTTNDLDLISNSVQTAAASPEDEKRFPAFGEAEFNMLYKYNFFMPLYVPNGSYKMELTYIKPRTLTTAGYGSSKYKHLGVELTEFLLTQKERNILEQKYQEDLINLAGVVSCGSDSKRDLNKISLDMLANSQMEKLYVKDLPTTISEETLKIAISRALETYELRLDQTTFNENIEITYYNKDLEVSESIDVNNLIYSLKATENSSYFSGESEIIKSKIASLEEAQIIDLSDKTKVAQDYSKYSFDINDTDYFRYVVMDESYIFGGLRLMLNEYQTRVELKKESGEAIITATPDSDRFKNSITLKNIKFK